MSAGPQYSDPTTPERIRVVNSPLDIVGMQGVLERVVKWTTTDKSHVAVGVNANVCNLASTNAEFKRMLSESDLAYADGQSVVWAARLLGGKVPERIATTDLINPLAARAEQDDLNLFFFGGAPEVAERAASQLKTQYPGLRIATWHGFIEDEDTPRLLEAIHMHNTHVLLVGLGDPAQLTWISRNGDRLRVPAILTCGGLFDWISGNKKRAPQWMIDVGCEWLWRLFIEPERLAKRYVLGNPLFTARLLGQWLCSRSPT